MTPSALQHFSLRRDRADLASRHARSVGVLAVLLAAIFVLTLLLGQSFTPPGDVLRVLLGQTVDGASFTVGQLRLPRAVLALLAGMSFGMAGVAFQTMLRNPLASPDIVGVSSGASAGAVFAIVALSLNGAAISVFAVASGLGVALAVYGLSFRNGVAGSRLILIGIGVSAMLNSVVAYLLTQAPEWSLQEAMRWLTGSLNGAQLSQAWPLLAMLVLCGGTLLAQGRDLMTLRLGDDMAGALGVRVWLTRLLVIVAAVGLVATATAATGPIAFVAFLAGPIAARLVGARRALLVPAALVGALLVLAGDYLGQFVLPMRYPVGVVTGALGAPYLIWLLVRANSSGSTL